MADLEEKSVWDTKPSQAFQEDVCITSASETVNDPGAGPALAWMTRPELDGLNTYAVLDPTLRKAVKKYLDLNVIGDSAQSLFNGRAAEENEEVAPYLVNMTPHDDQTLRFNQDFLDNHWGKNTGIIIRSNASFDDIRKHLRRFTKLRREGSDGWFFFRFWDPRIAAIYLRTIHHSAERAGQWFGSGLIDSFVIEEDEGHLVTTFGASAAARPTNRPTRSVILTDWELRPFRMTAYERDVLRMAEALKSDFSTELSSYSPEAIATIIRPTLDRFRQLGFRRKEHLHVIAAWGVFYGPEFIEKDHDGVLGRICAAEMSEQDKFAALKKRMAEFSKPEVRA